MRKSTVEESLALAIGEFRRRIFRGSSGSITWTRGNGRQWSVGYFVEGSPGWLILNLLYRWGDSEDVRIPIRLQTTPTQFDGERWWFTCPIVMRGIPCNRRVGKLYLPPGGKYFGCRKCHDLTYRSSQEAHQTERVERWLDNQFGRAREFSDLLNSRSAANPGF